MSAPVTGWTLVNKTRQIEIAPPPEEEILLSRRAARQAIYAFVFLVFTTCLFTAV